MKLTSVTLNDIRKFTAPVRVDGIDAGLNILSAPNEDGKSTLFDALQAVFFQPHRSKGKEVSALRPHAGGAPLVMVELTTSAGAFRIVKRWFSKPIAEVWQGTRLVAKADEAEAWIAALTQSKGDGGPAGLLWVRQGLTALDQGSTKERDQAQSARRDLMSSVSGEVETLTGGRRMDAAIRKCSNDLDRYVTGTGRSKTGGPLKAMEDRVEALEGRKRALTELTAMLRSNLDRRRAVRRSLTDLKAPEALSERRQRLDAASAAHQAAHQHADQTARALEAVTMARMALTNANATLDALRAARNELANAGQAAEDATAFDNTARAAETKSSDALTTSESDAKSARIALTAAEVTLRQALKAETARNAQARRAELTGRLQKAAALDASLEIDGITATSGPDGPTLVRLEEAAQAIEVMRKLRDSAAPDISMAYAASVTGGVTADGAPLVDGCHLPIPDGTTLELAGLGHLTIRPGKTPDDARKLAKLEAEFAGMLADCDLPDMAAARFAAAQRSEGAARVAQATATLAGLAPEGISRLKVEIAALPEDAAIAADIPNTEAAQTAVDHCLAARDIAETALTTARRSADQDRQTAARAAAASEGTAARLSRATCAIASFGDAESLERHLEIESELALAKLTEAEAAHCLLADAAPDVAAVEAALARARAVVEQAEAEAQRLGSELTQLDTAIDFRSGEGVDEELADITSQHAAASRHLDALRFEVAVLQELAKTLDTARASARDRYFEPILAELKPLLRLLWPDAELHFDGDSILPTALIRNGEAEPIDVLSGGTQEQIALLVRLAFATMLTKAGRHAPVILDDALVYTDDDRIERMFDALHREASGLQIIVLSCRQRAFRDLGGQKLKFAPCALSEELIG